MAYIYLIAAIACEVVATSALKLSDGFTKTGPSTITIIGYSCSFYLLALSLKTLSVGYTYAVWSGVGIILISLIGVFFLHEKVDLPGVIGIGMITAGVVVLSALSKMGGH